MALRIEMAAREMIRMHQNLMPSRSSLRHLVSLAVVCPYINLSDIIIVEYHNRQNPYSAIRGM